MDTYTCHARVTLVLPNITRCAHIHGAGTDMLHQHIQARDCSTVALFVGRIAHGGLVVMHAELSVFSCVRIMWHDSVELEKQRNFPTPASNSRLLCCEATEHRAGDDESALPAG